ncbi:MAG TPA: hypothetical protein VLA02_10295 [Reyranella sp.]|nr:hypothetical protein [Reyranella sp.]
MIRTTLLALALMGAAGAAHAQYVINPQPNTQYIVSSPPQPSPGDYTRQGSGLQPMDQEAQAVSPWRGRSAHQEAFRDEYGFRYDAKGHRIDAQGHHISPKTTTP